MPPIRHLQKRRRRQSRYAHHCRNAISTCWTAGTKAECGKGAEFPVEARDQPTAKQTGDVVADSRRSRSCRALTKRPMSPRWKRQAIPTSPIRPSANRGRSSWRVALLVGLSAMTYGQVAAILVELFPAKIRYTSMSIPYHIGTGYFGGFLPYISQFIVAQTGSPFPGFGIRSGLRRWHSSSRSSGCRRHQDRQSWIDSPAGAGKRRL